MRTLEAETQDARGNRSFKLNAPLRASPQDHVSYDWSIVVPSSHCDC